MKNYETPFIWSSAEENMKVKLLIDRSDLCYIVRNKN